MVDAKSGELRTVLLQLLALHSDIECVTLEKTNKLTRNSSLWFEGRTPVVCQIMAFRRERSALKKTGKIKININQSGMLEIAS